MQDYEAEMAPPPRRGIPLPQIETRHRSQDNKRPVKMNISTEQERRMKLAPNSKANYEDLQEDISKNIDAIRKRIEEQFPMGNYNRSRSQNSLSGLQKSTEPRKQYLHLFSKIKQSGGQVFSPRYSSKLSNVGHENGRPISDRPSKVQIAQYENVEDIYRNGTMEEEKATKTIQYRDGMNRQIVQKEEFDFRIVDQRRKRPSNRQVTSERNQGGEGHYIGSQNELQLSNVPTPKKKPAKYYLPEGAEFVDEKLEAIRRRNREIQAQIERKTKMLQATAPPHLNPQGYSDLQLNSNPIYPNKQIQPSPNYIVTSQEFIGQSGRSKPHSGINVTQSPPQNQSGMIKRIQAPQRFQQQPQAHQQQQQQIPEVLQQLQGRRLTDLMSKQSKQQLPQIMRRLQYQSNEFPQLIQKQTQQQQSPDIINQLQRHSKDLANVINKSQPSTAMQKNAQGRGIGVMQHIPQAMMPGRQVSGQDTQNQQLPPVLQQIQGKQLADLIIKETEDNVQLGADSIPRKPKKNGPQIESAQYRNPQVIQQSVRQVLDKKMVGLMQPGQGSTHYNGGPILRRYEQKGTPTPDSVKKQVEESHLRNSIGDNGQSIIDAINSRIIRPLQQPSGQTGTMLQAGHLVQGYPGQPGPPGQPFRPVSPSAHPPQQGPGQNPNLFIGTPVIIGSSVPAVQSQQSIQSSAGGIHQTAHFTQPPGGSPQPGGSRILPQSTGVMKPPSNLQLPPNVPGSYIVKSVAPTGPVIHAVSNPQINPMVTGAVPPSMQSIPGAITNQNGSPPLIIAYPGGGSHLIRVSQAGPQTSTMKNMVSSEFVPETERRLALGMNNFFQNQPQMSATGQLPPVIQASTLYPQQIINQPPQKKKHWYNKCCTIF